MIGFWNILTISVMSRWAVHCDCCGCEPAWKYFIIVGWCLDEVALEVLEIILDKNLGA